jgi:hypothetical protein
MKPLIRDLLVKALISESKKTEYEYQVRDIGGSDVFYKRKKGEKIWDFIDKEEFEKYSNKKNII